MNKFLLAGFAWMLLMLATHVFVETEGQNHLTPNQAGAGAAIGIFLIIGDVFATVYLLYVTFTYLS